VGPEGKIDPSTTSFASVVFGRGRVLGAWPLDILDDAALENACMFLVGRCGCRLKNENPGWDILLNLDWEKALSALQPADSKPAEAPTAPAAAKPAAVPETVKIVPDKPQAEAQPGKAPYIATMAAGLALLVVIPRWLKK
jgi:hypothetical protein